MASTDGTPAGQHCSFWELPQEILDIIFNLAYQRQSGLKFVFKKRWKLDEKIRRKEDFKKFVPKDFPG